MDKPKIDQLLDELIEKYDALVDSLCTEIANEHGGYEWARELMQGKIDDFKSVANEIRYEADTPGWKSDIERHTEDEEDWKDEGDDWEDDDDWDDPIE